MWLFNLLEITIKSPTNHNLMYQKMKEALNFVVLDTTFMKTRYIGHGQKVFSPKVYSITGKYTYDQLLSDFGLNNNNYQGLRLQSFK